MKITINKAPKKAPLPSGRPLTAQEFERSSIPKQLAGFLLGDFQHVQEEAERRRSILPGLQPTEHGQHYASGFGDGFNEAFRLIREIAFQSKEDTNANMTPTSDPDLE